MTGKSSGRIDTKLVQSGRRKEWTGAAVNPPVWHASTMLFDTVADLQKAAPANGTFYYGRHGAPTSWALAEALTALEPGAAGTRLFPSGVAAIAMALLTVLRPGDDLLMVDNAYGPTRAFCDGELRRLGITTRYYDPLVGAGIAELIGKNTRAIFLESPGSLTFEVQDVPAICAAAKANGVVTLLDNTWATPYFFQAIASGIDLSIVSCTKYIGGHSDLMMGAVTAADSCWKELERRAQLYGQVVAPDDASMAARGLRTLGVRLERHQQNAIKVAQWLATQPQVARVLHPALSDCPGHAHWARDYRGASGLFSIVLNGGGAEQRARFIDGLEHFAIGYSWGGFESLAIPADPERLRRSTTWGADGPLVRLHIGLEDPDDLIADLERGLRAYPYAPHSSE
ncbi:MAG: cystathionine beta-lyase [Pseudomonadota bacterium]